MAGRALYRGSVRKVFQCALMAASLGAVMAWAAPQWIVEAGRWDRVATPVQVDLDLGSAKDEGLELVSEAGVAVPVQREPDGTYWFVVRDLPRGTKRAYTLRTGAAGAVVATATRSTASVRLDLRGREVFTYRTSPTEFPGGRPDLTPAFRRGAYIHPVLTPSGVLVTDDYPENHRHHHGIWFAWSQAVFEGRKTDTWNMGDLKGTVEFVGLDSVWSGPVTAGFRSRHRQIDLTSGSARPMLEEVWNVRLLDLSGAAGVEGHVFDVDVTDACAGEASVQLPLYRYGGIGVRGNWAWNGTDRMHFLNSEGVTNRSKGDLAETVGRWAYLGGPVGGRWGGLAVLGHPGNVYAPQPQRIHPSEPFLSLAPQQAGEVEIAPGRPLRLRYRFVALDGPPDARVLDRLWQDYAEPPAVRGSKSPGLMINARGELIHEGRLFRGVGVNYFDLFSRTLADAGATNHWQNLRMLATNGIPYVRFMAGGFWPSEQGLWQTNRAEFLKRYDGLVRAAEDAGIGLIPCFCWHPATVPDVVGEPVKSWGNPESRTHSWMREYVGEMVRRGKASSAIWAWEFGNEFNLPADLPNAADHRPAVVPEMGTPRNRTADDELTHEHIRKAVSEFGKEVRRWDPDRLLISGNGFPRKSAWHQKSRGTWDADTDAQWKQMLLEDNPNPVNSLSGRLYGPEERDRLSWAMAAARESGKPLIVGEFGVPGPDTPMNRDRFRLLLTRLEREKVAMAALWVFDFIGQSGEWSVEPSNDRAWQLEEVTAFNRRLAGGSGAGPDAERK